ncbi:MAG: hypothetical protein WCF94_00510 [bacterium]
MQTISETVLHTVDTVLGGGQQAQICRALDIPLHYKVKLAAADTLEKCEHIMQLAPDTEGRREVQDKIDGFIIPLLEKAETFREAWCLYPRTWRGSEVELAVFDKSLDLANEVHECDKMAGDPVTNEVLRPRAVEKLRRLISHGLTEARTIDDCKKFLPRSTHCRKCLDLISNRMIEVTKDDEVLIKIAEREEKGDLSILSRALIKASNIAEKPSSLKRIWELSGVRPYGDYGEDLDYAQKQALQGLEMLLGPELKNKGEDLEVCKSIYKSFPEHCQSRIKSEALEKLTVHLRVRLETETTPEGFLSLCDYPTGDESTRQEALRSALSLTCSRKMIRLIYSKMMEWSIKTDQEDCIRKLTILIETKEDKE